ncbi:hypothetical protein K438DRAFT_1858543 [Mycena galopus ATCC 62051]|nr:hypothetical protein K438DRAFT_1858543 [Mycena galopus ATCC 62051]
MTSTNCSFELTGSCLGYKVILTRLKISFCYLAIVNSQRHGPNTRTCHMRQYQ